MTAAAFSADWLRLREPFDTLARADAAADLGLASWLAEVCRDAAAPCRVVDLACGTGANLRALLPGLGTQQRWLLVDNDPALLVACRSRLADWATQRGYGFAARGETMQIDGRGFDASIELRQIDLARDLAAVPLASATLVTASALLDLVGAAWLQRLVDASSAAGAAVLFALTVDGAPRWHGGHADDRDDPHDAAVTRAFQAHQARDKGFGPALGPAAAAAVQHALRRAGYLTANARSDWVLSPAAGTDAVALQRALVEGIAQAASEQDPDLAVAARAWRERRLALAPRSALTIGHLDIIARPPAAR